MKTNLQNTADSFFTLIDVLWALKPATYDRAVIPCPGSMVPYSRLQVGNNDRVGAPSADRDSRLTELLLMKEAGVYSLLLPVGDGTGVIRLKFGTNFCSLETLSMSGTVNTFRPDVEAFKVGSYCYRVEDLLSVVYINLDNFYVEKSGIMKAIDDVVAVYAAGDVQMSSDFVYDPLDAFVKKQPAKALPKPQPPTFDWDL